MDGEKAAMTDRVAAMFQENIHTPAEVGTSMAKGRLMHMIHRSPGGGEAKSSPPPPPGPPAADDYGYSSTTTTTTRSY